MLVLTRFSLLSMLPVLALGLKKRANDEPFQLYGYGEKSFGGLPLYFSDGYAHLGDPKEMNNTTDAAIAMFTTGSDKSWVASPNITEIDGNGPAWDNLTFYIPGPSASDHRVGFLSSSNNSSSEDVITTGFSFYGSTATHLSSTGGLETLWFVLNETGKPHTLYWNDTSLGQVPIVLRKVVPTRPSF